VLGALSFVGFAMLAIPERIGDGPATGAPSLKLGNHFSRTPSAVEQTSDFSNDSATEAPPPSPPTRLASRSGSGEFPKRGFTPPLDRPAPAAPPQPALSPPPVPAAPPPEPAAPPPPAPAAEPPAAAAAPAPPDAAAAPKTD
jgi:hypothetical protein